MIPTRGNQVSHRDAMTCMGCADYANGPSRNGTARANFTTRLNRSRDESGVRHSALDQDRADRSSVQRSLGGSHTTCNQTCRNERLGKEAIQRKHGRIRNGLGHLDFPRDHGRIKLYFGPSLLVVLFNLCLVYSRLASRAQLLPALALGLILSCCCIKHCRLGSSPSLLLRIKTLLYE